MGAARKLELGTGTRLQARASIPYAGVNRIRFEGYGLSPRRDMRTGTPPIANYSNVAG